jgi:hypothetical protein
MVSMSQFIGVATFRPDLQSAERVSRNLGVKLEKGANYIIQGETHRPVHCPKQFVLLLFNSNVT